MDITTDIVLIPAVRIRVDDVSEIMQDDFFDDLLHNEHTTLRLRRIDQKAFSWYEPFLVIVDAPPNTHLPMVTWETGRQVMFQTEDAKYTGAVRLMGLAVSNSEQRTQIVYAIRFLPEHAEVEDE